ncbi:hypothetical protein BGI41_02580 [Methanobrevibacter sp. 87.7]|uniref:glycosyltransferase family 2 protein n=1 Tax=Methanobrevibacter sp. 87.7 TaxID=387957 RepID=UPI000B4FF839|nr:glycosyltransferase family 2 protein [Methanobrevibacter sp. 87.7]OWT33399.1 hypothetical protein BGI41_02580 [Methanobrevibacter sp. 87.7]
MSNILSLMSKSKFNAKKALKYSKAYDKIIDLGLFDEEFYKTHYSNYYSANPLEHYLFYGYKKGFDPCLNFNTFKYLNNYPDVKKSGLNPLVHYVLYGINENREIFPSQYLIKERILDTNKLYLNNHNFTNEPLVSIIVLNRNGVNHLKTLFKDFSKKTNYSNFELIFIDNDSSDNSVNYIKSLDLDFPVKIIENSENLSFSEANNIGVDNANGEFVLLLNNDIEPSFGWLNEMVATILSNDNIAAVGAKLLFPYYDNIDSSNKSFKIQHSGDIFSFNKYLKVYAYNNNLLSNPFDFNVNTSKKVVSVTAAAILIRKSIYTELGGLDEGYIYGYEDVDFSLKLNKSGYDVVYCSSALLFHHESSTRTTNKNFKNNSDRLINKWYNYLNRNIFLDKLNKDKFFSNEPLKFLFLTNKLNKFILDLSKKLENEGFIVELSSNSKEIYSDSLTDVIISFDTNINIEDIDLRENTIKILCLEDIVSMVDLDLYDLIFLNDLDNYNSFNNSSKVYYLDSDYNNIINRLKDFILEKYPSSNDNC